MQLRSHHPLHLPSLTRLPHSPLLNGNLLRTQTCDGFSLTRKDPFLPMQPCQKKSMGIPIALNQNPNFYTFGFDLETQPQPSQSIPPADQPRNLNPNSTLTLNSIVEPTNNPPWNPMESHASPLVQRMHRDDFSFEEGEPNNYQHHCTEIQTSEMTSSHLQASSTVPLQKSLKLFWSHELASLSNLSPPNPEPSQTCPNPLPT